MRLTAEIETAALVSAMGRLSESLGPSLRAVARRSAERVKAEAQRRVARQTGETAKGIVVEDDYAKTGFIVRTSDTLSQEDLRSRKGRAKARGVRFRKGLHVGTYLEYGTVYMSARPFFYPSARLEEPVFDRAVREAVQDAIDLAGLGS